MEETFLVDQTQLLIIQDQLEVAVRESKVAQMHYIQVVMGFLTQLLLNQTVLHSMVKEVFSQVAEHLVLR